MNKPYEGQQASQEESRDDERSVAATAYACPNLVHQFMDTNFLPEAGTNNLTILQAISATDSDQLFTIDPPPAVDYLSSKLSGEAYFDCWRSISNNRFMKPYELSNLCNLRDVNYFEPIDDVSLLLPSTSRARLENACWRAWYKSLRHLDELDPADINWYKVNDETRLYGPILARDQKRDSLEKTSEQERSVSPPIDMMETSEFESDGSESDSLMEFHGTQSSSSVSTQGSTGSATTATTSYITPKPILKKRRRPSMGKQVQKRISFCPEVQVGVFYEDE